MVNPMPLPGSGCCESCEGNMAKVEENEQLADLSRKYADLVITREEFVKQRKALLDDVDARYNNRHYRATEIMSEIKNKVKDAVRFVKNHK
jgi:hypothetical protein